MSTFNTYNTIKVKKYSDVIEEIVAGGAIIPGMFLALNSSGEVIAHNSADANILPMVALEDELQGNGIDDAYAEDDPVQVWIPYRGDNVYAILADGQNISIGDFLQSSGDGTLKTAGSGVAIAVALEDVDLSDSSGAESSGPLGYRKRILVRML